MSLKNTQSNKKKTGASSRSILEIGKGSFGEVFKGIDNRTQQVDKDDDKASS